MTATVELDPLTGAIVADLPKPPGDNHYYAVVHGRKVLSRAGRQFRELVAVASRLGRVPMLTGRLYVSVTYQHHDRGRCDIANRLKALCDAMTGCVYEDDSQIDDLRIVRGQVVKGGRVRVRVVEVKA